MGFRAWRVWVLGFRAFRALGSGWSRVSYRIDLFKEIRDHQKTTSIDEECERNPDIHAMQTRDFISPGY